MGLHPQSTHEVPELTAQVAQHAFPRGNLYLDLADHLNSIYTDEEFADLYPSERGRPAYSPARLALCLIVQFAEGLSDRQLADAVRARIDLKYLLRLNLDDPGFDHTLLSDFRERLRVPGQEARLLDQFLAAAQAHKLLRARGRQRTDATHVVAAVRKLNRLECVGETLRAALNDLARVAPAWLACWTPPEWYQRYGPRFEQYRLPKSRAEREALAVTIGGDGCSVLQHCYAPEAPAVVRTLPAVEILRQVWLQQYKVEDGVLHWRTAGECPPAEFLIQSPYDIEAHYSRKKSLDTAWVGYKVHVTETCDEDLPHLIVNVETTSSTTPEVQLTPLIHDHLAAKGLLPQEHLVDSGYIDAQELVASQDLGLELLGPVQPDSTRQGREQAGYEIACFAIDWEAQQVRCPQGHVSQTWSTGATAGSAEIQVSFAKATCQSCPSRSACTQATTRGRSLKLLPREQHLARQARRQEQ